MEFKVGDKVIITSYCGYTREESKKHFDGYTGVNGQLQIGSVVRIDTIKGTEVRFAGYIGGSSLSLFINDIKFAYVTQTPLYKAIYGESNEV